MYRILRAEDQLKHREPSQPARRHKPTEYVATGPCQVWSWDITYLRSSVRGTFFYLYMIMDIWSRKIVGWDVQAVESTLSGSGGCRAAPPIAGGRAAGLSAGGITRFRDSPLSGFTSTKAF